MSYFASKLNICTPLPQFYEHGFHNFCAKILRFRTLVCAISRKFAKNAISELNYCNSAWPEYFAKLSFLLREGVEKKTNKLANNSKCFRLFSPQIGNFFVETIVTKYIYS